MTKALIGVLSVLCLLSTGVAAEPGTESIRPPDDATTRQTQPDVPPARPEHQAERAWLQSPRALEPPGHVFPYFSA